MVQKDTAKKQKNEREYELPGLLKVLADENRLKILSCLKTGEKCVCQLTQAMKISQNLMSHHLKILKDARLISSEKRGRWVYYSIKSANLNKLLDRMEKICDCTNIKC